jgi:hypothetical protein
MVMVTSEGNSASAAPPHIVAPSALHLWDLVARGFAYPTGGDASAHRQPGHTNDLPDRRASADGPPTAPSPLAR